MGEVLHIKGLTAGALTGLNLTLAAGECLALTGPRGVGKSTLLRGIAGLAPTNAEAMRFQASDLLTLDAAARARAGIALCAEGGIFATLTVAENLALGARLARPGPWTPKRVWALFPDLRTLGHRPAARISGGQAQMLTLGRALLANPALLLVDEVTTGLSPLVAGQIHQVLDVLTSEGMALIVAGALPHGRHRSLNLEAA